MEMKRKSQKRPQNPYLQQLTAKADEQGEKLTALRKVQDQVDSYKLSNSALGMSEMILYADVLVFSDLLYQQDRKSLNPSLSFGQTALTFLLAHGHYSLASANREL